MSQDLRELATLLARGYLRLLARKAVPVAQKALPGGLDDVGEPSLNGGRLTDGERP